MEDIDFGVDFVARNSNKLQKIGFGQKINQLSPWCVHTLANDPQASLVSMKEGCLFVLFVTLRSPKRECLLSHS